MHIKKQPTPDGKHPKVQNDSTKNFTSQPTSWNKHDGRANTSKTVAGLHKTKNAIYNWNSQADNNLGHPKSTPEDTKITALDKSPFTTAKSQRHRGQHPEKQNVSNHKQHQRRPKPNFNHDTHCADAKPSDHQQHQNVSRRPHSGTKHTQM